MEYNVKYIILVILIVLLIYGLVTGEFVETWRNGATL